jgi:hypothetical protein
MMDSTDIGVRVTDGGVIGGVVSPGGGVFMSQ